MGSDSLCHPQPYPWGEQTGVPTAPSGLLSAVLLALPTLAQSPALGPGSVDTGSRLPVGTSPAFLVPVSLWAEPGGLLTQGYALQWLWAPPQLPCLWLSP